MLDDRPLICDILQVRFDVGEYGRETVHLHLGLIDVAAALFETVILGAENGGLA